MLSLYNLFILFSALGITSAICAILVSNPIHGILYLIVTFINVACILLLLKIDVIALCLITVYIGAVAVLFLFVIMMINIRIKDQPIKKFFFNKFLLTFIFGLSLSFCFIHALFQNFNYITHDNIDVKLKFFILFWNFQWYRCIQEMSILDIIGKILYNEYFIHFLIASLLLFVAMIASIVLTMRPIYDINRQQYAHQLSRNPHIGVFRVKRKQLFFEPKTYPRGYFRVVYRNVTKDMYNMRAFNLGDTTGKEYIDIVSIKVTVSNYTIKRGFFYRLKQWFNALVK